MRAMTAVITSIGLLAGIAVAGLPPVPVPPENPISEPKRVLGKILFWDEQLSSDDTVACGTCHRPTDGGADARLAVHPGPDGEFGGLDDIRGSFGVRRADAHGRPIDDPLFGFDVQVTPRSAPSVINNGYLPELFWDGRSGSTFIDPLSDATLIPSGGALEIQALQPILGSREMAHDDRTWGQVTEQLARSAPLGHATDLPIDTRLAIDQAGDYPALFEAAFGDPAITPARIAFAIATYERTLVSDHSPWDRFIAGDVAAMNEQERAGWLTFRRLSCSTCHVPPLFTDGGYRNIGVRPIVDDPGRQAVTGLESDAGRFKVPSLRNAGLKEHLMHNGRVPSMREAIRWYVPDHHTRVDDNLDPLLPIEFTADEMIAMEEFVREALVDPRVEQEIFPFDRPELHGGAARQIEVGRHSVAWPALAGVRGYRLYRGRTDDLREGDADRDGWTEAGYGACLIDGQTLASATEIADIEIPPPGEGWFYLRAVIDRQGERAAGTNSAGRPRAPAAPCPELD